MPDREKVIKGLDVCLKNIDRPDCPNDCPYLSDCLKYENRVVFQPLMRDAIALLKEQEAKTGYWIDSAGNDKCSICGAEYSDLYPDYGNTPFCPNCGAKMEGR